jgi:hypothetical protein
MDNLSLVTIEILRECVLIGQEGICDVVTIYSSILKTIEVRINFCGGLLFTDIASTESAEELENIYQKIYSYHAFFEQD